MTPMVEAQERARQFNQDEAVWRRFESKRLLRRLFGCHVELPDEALDAIDWREAEREMRPLRCIGTWIP